jgi:hypothetical protein
MKRVGSCFPILCGLLLFGFGAISAQTIFMNPIPEDKPKISFRFLHPDLKGEFGPTALSGEYELALSVPLNETINLTASMPTFHQAYDVKFFNDESGNVTVMRRLSENAFGNLFLEIQTRQVLASQVQGSASFGLYLPTAKYEYKYTAAYIDNLFTNPYEMRANMPKTLVFYGNYAIRMQNPAPVTPILGLEIGPEIYIPTENLDSRNSEVLFHYGVSFGVKASYVVVQGELLGLFLASESGLDFTDRFDHFAAFGAQATDLPVRPGVFYQLPIDEGYRLAMNGILGVKLNIVLP